MRYLAYAGPSSTEIGVVDGDQVRRLTTLDEFYADPAAWSAAEATGAAVPRAELHEVPPVPQTAQIMCLGLNYQAHIDEVGRDRPPAPNLFARWYAGLVCDQAEIPVPSGEPGLDWECELAVIIGTEMTDVAEGEAMDGVLGYTCFNDVSARTHQRATPQWALGKNATNSGPIGPWVVTADELGDPYGRRIETRYNGDTVQSSTTGHMIFSIAETIAYATRCVTLRPGDVIATGTPSGVGSKMDPPVFMGPGDRVEVEIEGIGVLTNHIVARS
ncbi:MAG: fumarylacetoacetate hydrolase family protein [Acidimicrobiales bacterium]